MKEIGAFEAKTHLSRLLEDVRHGETYLITRRGEPVARLAPVGTARDRDLDALIASARAVREASRPGPESIRELIEEGRRW